MKILVLGEWYPVVTIQFHNRGVTVTYFDALSAAPGLLQYSMALVNFRALVAYQEAS